MDDWFKGQKGFPLLVSPFACPLHARQLDCVKTHIQGRPLLRPLATGPTGSAAAAPSHPSMPHAAAAGRAAQGLGGGPGGGLGGGALSVALALVRERGPACLFRGLAPSLLRSALVAATRFSAFEAALVALRGFPKALPALGLGVSDQAARGS
jgi:hypothetical protein